jgi:hypothetical protein
VSEDDSQAGSAGGPWGARGTVPASKVKVPLLRVLDGGVFIVSKYRIVDAKQAFFRDCSNWDCGAKKGIVYVRIDKDGRLYNIFGLHSDTSDEVQKQYQYPRIHQVIREIVKDRNEPVLIAVDFNFSGQEDPRTRSFCGVWPQLKVCDKLLDKEDPKYGTSTCDNGRCILEGNDELGSGGCTVDGVVFSDEYRRPLISYNQPRPLYSKQTWGVRTGFRGKYKLHLYAKKSRGS